MNTISYLEVAKPETTFKTLHLQVWNHCMFLMRHRTFYGYVCSNRTRYLKMKHDVFLILTVLFVSRSNQGISTSETEHKHKITTQRKVTYCLIYGSAETNIGIIYSISTPSGCLFYKPAWRKHRCIHKIQHLCLTQTDR